MHTSNICFIIESTHTEAKPPPSLEANTRVRSAAIQEGYCVYACFRLVSKILKAPAESAGPADSKSALIFLLTSPEVAYRKGHYEAHFFQYSFGMGSQPAV